MKKIVSAMLTGLQIGSLAYLLVLAVGVQKSAPTPSNIYSVLLMSALIGVVTLIFKSECFSRLILLLLHCCFTAALVCLTMVYNGWLDVIMDFHFWLDFFLIYLFVWFFMRLSAYLQTQQINKALFERRKQKEEKAKKREWDSSNSLGDYWRL